MILGELEKLVLNYFWSVPEADAKQTHGHFSPLRGGTLNTIQSTLDRLYKKGLLERKKNSHAYVYSAACSRNEFISRLVHSVTEDFVQPEEAKLMAAFVSLSTKLDEARLTDLEILVRKYEARGKENVSPHKNQQHNERKRS